MRLRRPLCLSLITLLAAVSAHGAELPLRQIVEALFKAKPGVQLDYSGKDLSLLDLSGVDFKRANLAGANMLGDDLSGANLTGVKLAGAKLDRTLLARANFNGADLSHATLFDAVGSLTFEAPVANAPTFVGADLSGARIFARLSRADFRNANLSGARLGTERNQFKMPKQTDLRGVVRRRELGGRGFHRRQFGLRQHGEHKSEGRQLESDRPVERRPQRGAAQRHGLHRCQHLRRGVHEREWA